MGKSCCDEKLDELAVLAAKQSKTLRIVLAINLVMFVIEGAYGIIAHSVALLADSLDMLGDAFVYGFSLYVLGKSVRWNAAASLLKGAVMMLFGIGVFANAVYRYFSPSMPSSELMGIVGFVALAANVFCAYLLLSHRSDDLNMRSAWLCSRNDVIANLGVLVAAGGVAVTGSNSPDLLVGICIAALVVRSAFGVLKQSLAGFPRGR